MTQDEINQIKAFLCNYLVAGNGIRVTSSYNNAIIEATGQQTAISGGGMPPPAPVLYLPTLPTAGFAWVRWLTEDEGQDLFGEDGTGDGQVWCAVGGVDTRWHPMYKFSALSGEPPS
jgi:hypothetical protein